MRYALLLCSIVVLIQSAFAQQDSSRVAMAYRLTLTDGSEILGSIVKEDSLHVEFRSLSGIMMAVPRNRIKAMTSLSRNAANGEYGTSDPNYTRLFFAPTGRALKSGQGYFSAYEIFFPFIAIGIADAVTLAGGVSLFPGIESEIYYFAPKFTPLHLQNFDLSVGLLYVNSWARYASGGGIMYGVGTYGSKDQALTVGLGWGFTGGDIANKPVVLLGGEVRISNTVKIITENWIPPGTDLVFYSVGLRFFGENLAADLGFVHPSQLNSGGFPFVPWLGFAYNFGAK